MNYQQIKPFDLNNGKGIRVTIWVSGCALKCKGCFNSDAQDPNSGELYTEDVENKLIKYLSENYIDGLTILGGDPLFPGNIGTVTELCKKIKDLFGSKKTIWAYTGYVWENIKNLEMFKYIDVLIDGPFIEERKNLELKFCGSDNQRIINVQKSLENGVVEPYMSNK